jgi:uncharacterized protein DUF3108
MHIRTLIRSAAFALMAAILTACGAITVAPTPTLQPTATPTPSGDLCANTLIPVKAGATWTYNVAGNANINGASGSSSFTATISKVRADGFTVTTDFGNNVTSDQEWDCKPDGLLATSFGSGQATFTISSQEFTANLDTSNPSGITLPRDIDQHTNWDYGLDLTGSLAQGNLKADVKGNIGTEMHAAGTESVTVPAGTFDARKVQGTSTVRFTASFDGLGLPVTSVINFTLWFAPGVGWVKSLANGGLAGTTLGGSTELQSYKIP